MKINYQILFKNLIVRKSVYKDFISYCKAAVEVADFSKGGTCNDNYSVSTKANIIIRIDDNGYRVTGLFR